jgi:hypothetical protein
MEKTRSKKSCDTVPLNLGKKASAGNPNIFPVGWCYTTLRKYYKRYIFLLSSEGVPPSPIQREGRLGEKRREVLW